MKTRDIVIGLIVLIILISGVLIIKKAISRKSLALPTTTTSISQKIQTKFKNFNIPDGVTRTELKDVTGGEAMGIATDTEVLADLPQTTNNYFYQVWSNDNGILISLGKMRMAKGGYIFEGNLKNKKIVVSREKIFDNKLEVKVLE